MSHPGTDTSCYDGAAMKVESWDHLSPPFLWQETVGRFEIDGREGDHLPDRPGRDCKLQALGRS